MILNTDLFDLKTPIKSNFNGLNAVLISETQMDSINLKYLKFNVISSELLSFRLKFKQLQNELKQAQVKVEKLTKDNTNLSTINALAEKQSENDKKIHANELLYYKEKSKGKLTSFLLGSSVGALIVTLVIVIAN